LENKTATKTGSRTSKAGTTSKKTAGTTSRSRSGGTKSQASAGRKPSKQQQDAGTAQRSGAGTTMADAGAGSPPAPMFGGTRQVSIEEVAMTTRGGRRQGPEPYPFGELPASRIQDGTIIGPSFFVPESDNPKKIIAAGRKRHKGSKKIFLTRQMESVVEENKPPVPGVRVWLAPANYNQ
jgi:hypothetical protein